MTGYHYQSLKISCKLVYKIINYKAEANNKSKTVAFYLFALYFQHIDYEYSTSLFKSLKIKLILACGRSFFYFIKLFCLFITKNILQILTSASAYIFNNPNPYITFKIAQIGFIRLGKIIYTANKKVNILFKDLNLIRSYVTFFEKRSIYNFQIQTK